MAGRSWGQEGWYSMETRADKVAQDEGTAPVAAPVRGSVRRTPQGGPTTADGARYLEDLRARRRAEPEGGLRIFNPDETPEERDERISRARAWLATLDDAAE